MYFGISSHSMDVLPPDGHINVTARAIKNGVEIFFEDDGPGIPPAQQGRIFEPFFTTKDVGKGIGMGLTLCHKIMEEMDGRIDLVSGPGEGTAVSIELPAGGDP